MIKVCAKYFGTTILLKEFEDKEQAKEFMKCPYLLYSADEIEDGEDDELIYPNEMFIDNNQATTDLYEKPACLYDELDDLPF